jgi:hypothetical protein
MVDGAAVEGTGAERTLRLDPGAHRVSVTAGDQTEEIDVTLASGETQTRAVNLEQTIAEPDPQPVAPPPSGETFGTLGIIGAIVAGVGVASFAVMIGTGVSSDETFNFLKTNCADNGDGTYDCMGRYDDRIADGSTMALTSTIFTVVGSLALAAGVVLIAVDLADGSGESARLELTPGPTLAGLGGRVRF